MEDFVQTRFGYCFYEVKEDSALVYGLFVHPEYRMQGKAKRLLMMVIAEIRNTGYRGGIEIEAIPKEDGVDLDLLIKLYTSMGLKVSNVAQHPTAGQ